MNIFYTDKNPKIAARNLCNKHIVKMPLEAVQMLCTVFHLNGINAPYKKVHEKHPCVLWLLKSMNNIDWLIEHSKEMFKEYSKRYNKIHKSEQVLDWCISNKNRLSIQYRGLLEFPQAMPDKYKSSNSLISYRNYYIGEKLSFAVWPVNKIPSWIGERT